MTEDKVLAALDAFFAGFGGNQKSRRSQSITGETYVDTESKEEREEREEEEGSRAGLCIKRTGSTGSNTQKPQHSRNYTGASPGASRASREHSQPPRDAWGLSEVEHAALASRINARIAATREQRGLSVAEPSRPARDELECRWHLEHGERVDRGFCAGCRRPFGPTDTALDLADGNRVHIADGYDCLIRHGTRWRAAARAAVGQTAEAAPSSPVTTMP